MKPQWLLITIVSAGLALFGMTRNAIGQWPEMGYGSSYGAPPMPMNYGGPGYGTPSIGTPSFGGAGAGGFGAPNGCGDSCGISYGDFAGGYGSGSVGSGGGLLGGLSAGCQPVGLLGKIAGITGIGGGCANSGYNPAAFTGGPGMRQPANPYGQHPGFGMDNEFINNGDVCCGPHWYDVMVEGVFLQRTGDGIVGLMSEGPRGFGDPNLVLSSGDLGGEFDFGMRVVGRLQLNAVKSLEVAYLGGLDFNDSQRVVSEFDDLFSVYSDFGVSPLGGFEDTDQAFEATTTIHSELESGEVNFRRDWISENNRTSGSLMFGGRYIRLDDTVQFATQVRAHIDDVTDPGNPVDFGPGSSSYDVLAENDLLGVHAGGEMVRCIFPGFLFGIESKFGVYANSAAQTTNFNATTGLLNFQEFQSDTGFAYSTDAQVFLLWQIHPLAKIRSGYEILFIDGVATGFGNFNSADVFSSVQRNPVLSQDQDVLFHGFKFGIEFGW